MTSNDFSSLDKIQQTVRDCTKKPEAYLSVQERAFQNLKNCTKQLYDLALKSKLSKNSNSKALPELIIDGFDTEQIWQQLELENNEEFGRLNLGNISKVLASKKSWVLPLKVTKDDPEESEHSENEGEEPQDIVSQNSSDDDFTDSSNKTKKKTVTKSAKKRKRTTEVDDKFFKLDELDEFLMKEDKRELNASKKSKGDSSDEDNESIDLFNDLASDPDDEDEQDDDEESKGGRSCKYADFFDSPESCDEDMGEEINDGNEDEDMEDDDDDEVQFNKDHSAHEDEIQHRDFQKEKKQVKFNLLDNSDESDDPMEEDVPTNDQDKTKTNQSSLEVRQERLKKRIQKLEEEAISEKPWQLKGETSASSRPQNSLLEEYVEFDATSRPAPVMTEQTTMKLEDIIRGRIKDKVWDDVVKKFKPVETPMEYKKKLILNQEKSKESLAQIYENEYLKQREALNLEENEEQEKEEPPEHVEIREKMHSLFRKLDALSNFHYTPKPAKPEIKIVSNVPAINMEEVAPIATSDATLLAPEEVQSKRKGELIGKTERSKTDKKRERRKKKMHQHVRAVHQSKQLVDGAKQKKPGKNAAVLEKLKGRNIINTEEDSSRKGEKSIKSSTAFFAQLQDQVESSIKAKTNKASSKKNKNTISAVRLKL